MLGLQPGLGVGHRILGLVQVLGGDEVRGGQPLQAGVLPLGGVQLDVQRVDLGLGLGEVGGGGLGRQAGLVVLQPGQDLTLADGVAFLDVDLAHDAGGAGGDLDHPAFDVGLAAGDGGIGRDQRMGLGHRLGLRLGRAHPGHGQGADADHDDGEHAEPESCFAEYAHEASVRAGAPVAGAACADSRIWPSSRWMTRSA